MKPFISVIIPAHNEESYLPATLEALGVQTYDRFEILVIANGCTDRTAEAARRRCNRVLEMDERGLSRARNLGAKKARGDLLVFLDADTRLEPDALDRVAREFRRRYAGGTLKGRPDTNRLPYRVIYFLKNFIHGTHLHLGSSGVILCWKDHFKACDGFDETLHLCENSDLLHRLRRFGGFKFVRRTVATTSMRRYERGGAYKVAWLWVKLFVLKKLSRIRHREYEPVR